jgi:hypothetical protein
MKWWRCHHGMPFNRKWPAVAARAKVTVAVVVAVCVALQDYASQQEERGSIEGFDAETTAVFYQIDQSAIEAVMLALQEKGFHDGKRLTNWEEYQRDESSTPRVQKHRLKRNETVTKQDETKGNEISSISKSDSGSSDPEKEVARQFEAFWLLYPRRQGRGQALKAFKTALTKTTIDIILQGVENYKKIKADYADWCMPATWLNGERWLDQPHQQPQPHKPAGQKNYAPTATGIEQERWRARMASFRKSGAWLPSYGPKPGEPGCEVPAEFLAS